MALLKIREKFNKNGRKILVKTVSYLEHVTKTLKKKTEKKRDLKKIETIFAEI